MHAVLSPPLTTLLVCAGLFADASGSSAQASKRSLPEPKSSVIYVAQPLQGVDPAQMKALIVNYHEYHFRFLPGVRKVESTYVPEGAVTRVYLEPSADPVKTAEEAAKYVQRSRAFMPAGTPPALVLRFETVSVPKLLCIPLPVGKSVR